MRKTVAVLALLLLAPAQAFGEEAAATAPAAENLADSEPEQPPASEADQAEQRGPEAVTCRMVRRTESRLSGRRERVCTPASRPQQAEAEAPGDAGEGAAPRPH